MARHIDGKILQRAIDLGLTGFSSMSPRKEVVRAIQSAQGKKPCYATDGCMEGGCGQRCEWYADFDGPIAIWLRN